MMCLEVEGVQCLVSFCGIRALESVFGRKTVVSLSETIRTIE
jgi:hypothetical protein